MCHLCCQFVVSWFFILIELGHSFSNLKRYENPFAVMKDSRMLRRVVLMVMSGWERRFQFPDLWACTSCSRKDLIMLSVCVPSDMVNFAKPTLTHPWQLLPWNDFWFVQSRFVCWQDSFGRAKKWVQELQRQGIERNLLFLISVQVAFFPLIALWNFLCFLTIWRWNYPGFYFHYFFLYLMETNTLSSILQEIQIWWWLLQETRLT